MTDIQKKFNKIQENHRRAATLEARNSGKTGYEAAKIVAHYFNNNTSYSTPFYKLNEMASNRHYRGSEYSLFFARNLARELSYAVAENEIN